MPPSGEAPSRVFGYVLFLKFTLFSQTHMNISLQKDAGIYASKDLK